MSIFFGRVEDGKIVLRRQNDYDQLVKWLDGKEVELELRKRVKSRTQRQNRYYFGVLLKQAGEAFGYTKEEMHAAFAMHFLMDRTKELPTVKSTTKLTTTEFSDYCENCRRLTAEMTGAYVEGPGEDFLEESCHAA